jgi:hypothetical protein
MLWEKIMPKYTPAQTKYYEKLKDPRWQKLRLEIMQRDDFTCQMCGDKNKTLNVHHRRYIKNTEPWDYPPHTLVTLCEICHEGEKDQMEENMEILVEQLKNKFFAEDILDLAEGFNALKMFGKSHVVSRMIGRILENEKLLKKLLKSYNDFERGINNGS